MTYAEWRNSAITQRIDSEVADLTRKAARLAAQLKECNEDIALLIDRHTKEDWPEQVLRPMLADTPYKDATLVVSFAADNTSRLVWVREQGRETKCVYVKDDTLCISLPIIGCTELTEELTKKYFV